MAEINLTTGANPIEIQSLGGAIEINGLVADPPVAPVAGFTISDDTPNVNATVTFTDTSTNSPTSWSWTVSGGSYSFVGGTSSTSQNPQIQFSSSSASYTVTLTATNSAGSDNFADGVVTNAAGSAPAASFTISDTTPDVNQTVTLTDTSTGGPTGWLWSILPATGWAWKAGSSASSQSPEVEFTDTSTTFTVSLTASNSFGSDGASDTLTTNSGGSTPAIVSGSVVYFDWGSSNWNGSSSISNLGSAGGTATMYGTLTSGGSGDGQYIEVEDSTGADNTLMLPANSSINNAISGTQHTIGYIIHTADNGRMFDHGTDGSDPSGVAEMNVVSCQPNNIGGYSVDLDIANRPDGAAWVHICRTYNSGVHKWYINGVLVETDTVTSFNYNAYSGQPFWMWRRPKVNAGNFAGGQAVMYLYGTELSASEVLQNYNHFKDRY